jgi:NAD(P)H-dependent FMN reductase
MNACGKPGAAGENRYVADQRKPFIVGIGGTATPGSSTEQALALALAAAEQAGATVEMFGGAALASLPHYLTDGTFTSPEGQRLVAAVRQADGLIIASPGYHGSISGMVKNAIDYIEETAKDARVYLDGVPVGLIATAYGWQATGSTLARLADAAGCSDQHVRTDFSRWRVHRSRRREPAGPGRATGVRVCAAAPSRSVGDGNRFAGRRRLSGATS